MKIQSIDYQGFQFLIGIINPFLVNLIEILTKLFQFLIGIINPIFLPKISHSIIQLIL